MGTAAVTELGCRWQPKKHHHQPQATHHSGHLENPRQPSPGREHGAQHECQRKGNANAGANDGRGFGALFNPGVVSGECHGGRGNGTGTLQQTADGQPRKRIRSRGHHAADHQQAQAANNYRLTANLIRQPAQRYLQCCLGQAVGTECQTDAGRRGARQLFSVNREQRQHHE